MISTDERVKALANVIESQAALLSTGSDQQDWFRSVEIAEALLDSPAMRDLLAEERAEAYDEACEHDLAVCRGDGCAYNPYRAEADR